MTTRGDPIGGGWGVHVAGVGWCLVLTLIVYAVTIHPKVEAGRQRQRQLQELGTREAIIERRRGSVDLIRQRITQAREWLAANTVRLQHMDRLNQRIDQLATLAGECGLVVHSAVPDAVRETERSRVVPIRVTGVGDFRTTGQMLHRLHETYPDINVIAFELESTPSESGGSHQSRFRFDLTWHAVRNAAFGAVSPK